MLALLEEKEDTIAFLREENISLCLIKEEVELCPERREYNYLYIL